MNEQVPPIYYKTFLKLSDKPEYRFKIFVESLEGEGQNNELMALYQDILSENWQSLFYIFKPTRADNVESIALAELTNLPLQTIGKDRSLFESIFHRAINHNYKNSMKVLENLHLLYSLRKTAISYGFLAEELSNPNLALEYRLRFAQALSENEDAQRFDWEAFNLEIHNELIPGYMIYFSKEDPEKAFYALTFVKEAFAKEFSAYFETPVDETIFNLLVVKKSYKEFVNRSAFIESETINLLMNDIIRANSKIRNYINRTNENSPLEYAGRMQANPSRYAVDLLSISAEGAVLHPTYEMTA